MNYLFHYSDCINVFLGFLSLFRTVGIGPPSLHLVISSSVTMHPPTSVSTSCAMSSRDGEIGKGLDEVRGRDGPDRSDGPVAGVTYRLTLLGGAEGAGFEFCAETEDKEEDNCGDNVRWSRPIRLTKTPFPRRGYEPICTPRGFRRD